MKRTFNVAALSDTGSVRSVNQDSLLVKIGEFQGNEFGLFAVADGLGGLAAGEVASSMVVDELKLWWETQLGDIFCCNKELAIDNIDNRLNILIQKVNKAIYEFGRNTGGKSATTLSMLFIYDSRYILKHIGDCRVYAIESQIRQLTEDHSWMANQVRHGLISPEESRKHIRAGVLTRCVGACETVDIFSSRGNLSDAEVLVLCSDGFYRMLDENEMENEIKVCIKGRGLSIQDAAERLMEKVKARGAIDNVSVIILCQEQEDGNNGIISRIRRLF